MCSICTRGYAGFYYIYQSILPVQRQQISIACLPRTGTKTYIVSQKTKTGIFYDNDLLKFGFYDQVESPTWEEPETKEGPTTMAEVHDADSSEASEA